MGTPVIEEFSGNHYLPDVKTAVSPIARMTNYSFSLRSMQFFAIPSPLAPRVFAQFNHLFVNTFNLKNHFHTPKTVRYAAPQLRGLPWRERREEKGAGIWQKLMHLVAPLQS
jgi:hypothetical protein